MLFRAILFLFAALTAEVGSAQAQNAVNAGRKFAFGIPEGPDRQVGPGGGESRIFLTFLGTTDGCAVIKGPEGFSATVNFEGTREREIELPISYMQKWEEGFNRKGFVVETTQPASIELHVVFEAAGESTHIFPMEMLDGDYLLSGWSLFDDKAFNENNRAQFLITAAEDNTDVTITAPNGLLPNIAAGTTFTVKLNAGECFIGKMDSTLNTELTTSQVIVKATKPVNVLQANTCGYVPYGVQSCNMLLDNVLPRKFFEQKFYMQPISRDVRSDHVILTSAQSNLNAITSDGTFYQTTNGRLDIIIDKPTMIETDAPAMAQILTPGSAQASLGLSDPTWTILPGPTIWDDTLKWYAQPPVGGSQPFAHYLTIVGPQSAFNDIMIDDAKLTDFATMNVITGTSMFSTQIGVPEGAHIVRAPEPIGVVANGIRTNDGYSLLPGGTLPNRYQPRPQATVDLTASSAQFCGEMQAQFLNSLALSNEDRIMEVNALIKYDPAVLSVVSANPGSFFASLPGTSVDLSTAGELRISAKPGKFVTGIGALLDAVFAVNADVSATSLSGSLTLTNDEICDNTRTFSLELPIEITRVVENAEATISLTDFRSEQNATATADLIVEGLPADAEVHEFDVILNWDQDLIELEAIKQNGTQSANWRIVRSNESARQVTLHVTTTNGETLSNGKLATLEFRAFLSDTNTTEIKVSALLPSDRKCPLVLTAEQTKAHFNTDLLCDEGLLLEAMAGRTLGASISPNPTSGTFRLELPRDIPGHAVLLDALGHEVYQFEFRGPRPPEVVLPSDLASGSYTLRLTAGAQRQDLPALIQK